MQQDDALPIAEKLTRSQESGFVMLVLLAALLPVLMLVGAHSVVMTSRNSRLMSEIRYEKAFLAGEAGIDEAIYRASNGILVDGVGFQRDLGNGMSFKVTPSYLKTDAIDNDGDGRVDELDENVYQLIVTGYYQNVFRRFAAYLRTNSPIPILDGAVYTDGFNAANMANNTDVSGIDVKLNGDPGDPLNDVAGYSIKEPGTVADLTAGLSLAGPSALVAGTGGIPSLAVSETTMDVDALATRVETLATDTLLNPIYNNPTLGDASVGDYRLIYRNGDLTLKGLSRGAGILVVRGNLELSNNFRFAGLIVVYGTVDVNQFSRVYGGVIQIPGPTGTFEISQHSSVNYCYEVMEAIFKIVPSENNVFGGWQELSRN